MIKFDSVIKSYGDQVAVRALLELRAGQTHILLGQSGSGKSTLIRMAAGLIRPTSGAIYLKGLDASLIADVQKAEIFGYMIQDGGLFPHLTCGENILLPARVHKLSDELQTQRLTSLTKMVGIPEDLLRRYPRQVSGGQRQRVALIRSLIMDPAMLFLDEPLGALDPVVRKDLQIELKAIFTDLKKTVILVTHDLSEAAFFADTITLLKEGEVEQHGSFDDFLEQPKSEFVINFFKAQRPPPRILNWTHKAGH